MHADDAGISCMAFARKTAEDGDGDCDFARGVRACGLGGQGGDRVPAIERSYPCNRKARGRCRSLTTNAVSDVYKQTIGFACLGGAISADPSGDMVRHLQEKRLWSLFPEV